jgi:hypothetical protein
MSWPLGGPSPLDALGAARGAAPASGPARAGGDFAGALRAEQSTARDAPGAVGATPPPEARAMLDAAQRAIRHLHEQGRELHFEVDGADVRIEVRDLDGRVLGRIPPARALDLLTDGPGTLEQP